MLFAKKEFRFMPAVAAVLEHRLAHRLRLKVPSRRGDVPFFEDLVRRLSALPGIAELRANPLTASLVIRHDGDTEAITSFLAREGLAEVRPAAEPLARMDVAAGSADANAALAVGLSSLSLTQAARGQLTGTASENLWNAYGAHRTLQSRWLTLLYLGLGAYQLANGRWLNSATALMFNALTAWHLAQKSGGEAAVGTEREPDGAA